jgi:hypothetical protein
MKKAIFIFFLFYTTCFAQNIPNDWIGSWYGILEISNPKGKNYSLHMELHLQKTDTVNNWRYTIVYDNGERRDERKYNLIKADSLPGLFIIDENNGIILNEVQIGNRMFQRFEVMDNVIYGITTYEKGKITWELVSDNNKLSYQSGKGDEEIPFVTTFLPTNYQRAVLTKKKLKPIKAKKSSTNSDGGK